MEGNLQYVIAERYIGGDAPAGLLPEDRWLIFTSDEVEGRIPLK